jgi:shikimate kinase
MSVAAPPPRHIVLVGLMGTGKTTVGRLLAAKLDWPLYDSDAEIEAREGASVRELQDRWGAGGLHRLEATVLLEALARAQQSVICAAASTIDDARCRAALRDPAIRIVWLRAKLATLVARYDSDRHRPRYPHGTAAALAEQLAARRAHFAQAATLTIDVDDLEPEAVLARLGPVISDLPG